MTSMSLLHLSPALPIAVPLFGAAALVAARQWLSRAMMDTCALLISTVTLAISSWLLLNAAHHGASVYWLGGWWPRVSMALGVDLLIEPIGAGLAALAALLTTLALLFFWRFINSGATTFSR